MVSLYGQVYVVIAFIHVRKNTKSSMSSDKMEKSLRGSVLPSYTDEDTIYSSSCYLGVVHVRVSPGHCSENFKQCFWDYFFLRNYTHLSDVTSRIRTKSDAHKLLDLQTNSLQFICQLGSANTGQNVGYMCSQHMRQTNKIWDLFFPDTNPLLWLNSKCDIKLRVCADFIYDWDFTVM